MLAMQLDTAVPLLEPLRERLLQVIPEDDSDESVRRARQYVAEWNGTADADQQGFRILVMVDRGLQDEMMWEMLPDDEEVQFGIPAAPLRRLIDEDVQEYMPSRFEEWSELDEATFRRMVRDIEMRKTEGEGIDLDWGEVNRSQFIHPFSMSGSALGSDRLNLPSHPQSGHPLAVRVAHPRFGASARMVVSPGREQDAILQTPGGQSGHFLSPYMSNFHEQWRTGEPTDLLPGEPVTIIRLVREDSEGE